MYELKAVAPLLLLVAPSLALPEAKPQWPWAKQPQQSAPQQQESYPAWNQGGNQNGQQGWNQGGNQNGQAGWNQGGNQNGQQGWNQGAPQQAPRPAFNPFGAAQQPGPQQTTVWIPNPNQQAPRPTPSQTKPDDDEPRWTPPAQWGPKSGRQPFGPKSNAPPVAGAPAPTGKPPATRPEYCSNKDLICTTTIDAPREPAPYKVTCGKTLFLEDDVSNALTSGCYYLKKNKKIGGSEFPKAFENRQNFDFGPVGKGAGQTLWEMPLIGSAAYAGGPVGPDRVIFSYPECFLAGELTQSANGYTECTEQY